MARNVAAQFPPDLELQYTPYHKCIVPYQTFMKCVFIDWVLFTIFLEMCLQVPSVVVW